VNGRGGCKIARWIAVAAALALLPAAARAQPAPGAWDVVQVAVDSKDQMHWLYVPADPRLLGRELLIAADAWRFNDGSDPCEKPDVSRRDASFAKLLAESFPRPPGPGRAATPTLGDFGLAASLNKNVTVYTPRCAPRSDGRDPQPWSEAWFVNAAPDRLLMRMGSSAVLTLARRTPNAAPQPSFACSAARTPIERMLCGSVALAALDRSVAAAYKRKRDTSDAGALRAAQAEWLKRRDACGQDEACVADAMRERIDELMQN
jgi:uncharacterized protein YecT (DUF1311 family)